MVWPTSTIKANTFLMFETSACYHRDSEGKKKGAIEQRLLPRLPRLLEIICIKRA